MASPGESRIELNEESPESWFVPDSCGAVGGFGGTLGSCSELDGDGGLFSAVFSGRGYDGVGLSDSDFRIKALDLPIFLECSGDGSVLTLPLDFLGSGDGGDSALLVLRRLREEERRWSNERGSLAFSMSLSRPRF